MRAYFDRGGFFMVDDFHNEREWESFMAGIEKIMPGARVVELENNDPIFHTVYDLNDRYQVPGARYRQTGVTEKRVRELLAKYGRDKVEACCARLFELGEATIRAAIAEWEDGRYEAERFIDDDGVDLNKPVRIHVVAEKKGDKLHFDFSGSADQAKGPANIRPPLVRATIAYCLISMIDPHMYVSSGLLNAYSFDAREGSVVNPRFPAPFRTTTL